MRLLGIPRWCRFWVKGAFCTQVPPSWIVMFALASLGFALGPPHRLYHKETIEQLAAGTVPWPYVETTGRVRLVRVEQDGDLHIKLTGVTAFIVLECIPELPCAKPALGQRIMARGIPRWDGEHSWAELHPLLSWAPAP